MEILKQNGYDDFRCIASACPESCCKLWQIQIDDESLENYKTLAKNDSRIREAIDRSSNCFKHVKWANEDKVCAFLDHDELCHLQKNYGEDALCDTCRTFPRHTEEFMDVREYSLSVACPHAARLLLTDTNSFTYSVTENNIFDDDDDFEDFDFLLYDRLLDAREDLFKIAKDRSLNIFKRLDKILLYAKEMQCALDEGHLFDDATYVKKTGATGVKPDNDPSNDFESFYEAFDHDLEKRCFSLLFRLEELHEGWNERIDAAWKIFFKADTAEEAGLFPSFVKLFEIQGENLLMLFLYTYFCGSVYDAWIFSKAALSVFFVKWIYYISFAMAIREHGDDLKTLHFYETVSVMPIKENPLYEKCLDILIQVSYQYAREVEHSDINLNMIEEWFMDTYLC